MRTTKRTSRSSSSVAPATVVVGAAVSGWCDADPPDEATTCDIASRGAQVELATDP